ncbi:aspartate aminotransferase family protein [Elioraea sp. Yellowstone]|jgi:adenosylmethionine-8-amino-7-oxononanoate aminotransferase|uniref:aspartate aminotransferase family protein n=1 Tax=Elioraea sp. Yellowstone TaxID=2592070 RepID=UPI001152FFD8|nr:aspartate aminotransferase family protein [Elioraea sp. Yellowstone]TQF76689.1 aspartate aminotransferase family protein [Elioraea sp. Yellowstone]
MAEPSRLIHRNLREILPVAVAGDGLWITDREGRRYADACGGAAVSCLGHAHPAIVAAVRDQVGRLEYAHTGFFSSEPAEALAATLLDGAPAGLSHAYIVSGGSEAVEAALKIARQYFVEIGEPARARFVARRQSYHGTTLGALSVGGNMARRALYDPILLPAGHVEPCFAYRCKRDDETEEEYAERAAASLEAEIARHPPGTVAAFLAETVVGATAGSVPPVPGYFRRIREICDRHGVLLILDEVMCGMGRCGTLHACEAEGIAPDILVVAKGLGAGFQPLGAILVNARIVQAIRAGSGTLAHGHTYAAHPVACAAGLAVQRVLRAEGMIARVAALGQGLEARLVDRFGNHAHVGDIRGRGLFWSLELVADRASKAPFDPARKLHLRVRQAAMARGLLVYPMGGTIDGRSGDHVTLAPPFTVTEDELDLIVDRLGEAVEAALAG